MSDLALLKTLAVSASAAEDMNLLIVLHWVKMAPFYFTKGLTGLVG